jgi:hypothetical protein
MVAVYAYSIAMTKNPLPASQFRYLYRPSRVRWPRWASRVWAWL